MSTQTLDWLTVKEAAAHLKVKPRTLLQFAKQGIVKAYVLSGTERLTYRFLAADLDAALQPVPIPTKMPPAVRCSGNRRTQ